jgi:hypothetical protein
MARARRGSTSVTSLLAGVDGSGQPAQLIRLVMAQVREQLGLDLVWVSQFTEGQRVFRYTHGDAELYGVEIDCGDPLEDTFCAKVVAGCCRT